ncbi:MAG: LysE family translocator [Actinomycetales bacterium]|nr:LysE family translocator [Actinomycetales bacterium]
MNNWIEFAIVAGLLTMLPGIDTAQILRSAIKGGPRLAYMTLLGIGIGVWVLGIAAAIGLSALLLASAEIYRWVSFIGAGYLLYIGVRMIWDARKVSAFEVVEGFTEERPLKSILRAATITLTNPKGAAFYVAVFPAYIPHDMNPALAGFTLASIHNLEALIWFSMWIWGTTFAKAFFSRPRVRQVMEAVSGLAMIGFGVKMLLDHQ